MVIEMQVPIEISAFLADLNQAGHNRDRVAEVANEHVQKLHPDGWRFLSLSDGLGEEWNISCAPPSPQRCEAYCLQTFAGISYEKGEPLWECYVVGEQEKAGMLK